MTASFRLSAAAHRHPSADAEPGSDTTIALRREVDRLSAGLPRAMLSTPVSVVRDIARRASDADDAARRRRARVGDRPELDDAAAAAILDAVAAHDLACRVHELSLRERQRWLAFGNLVGVAGIGAAFGLSVLGQSLMSPVVTATVLSSAAGPLFAAFVGADRCSLTFRLRSEARQHWAKTLEAAGVSTMGGFAARRVAISAWERREEEANAADTAARSHMRAWHRLAGPGISPHDVDTVIARVEALRSAQMRLLASLLRDLADADRPRPTPLESPSQLTPAMPTTWLSDAIDRIRGSRLRLLRD